MPGVCWQSMWNNSTSAAPACAAGHSLGVLAGRRQVHGCLCVRAGACTCERVHVWRLERQSADRSGHSGLLCCIACQLLKLVPQPWQVHLPIGCLHEHTRAGCCTSAQLPTCRPLVHSIALPLLPLPPPPATAAAGGCTMTQRTCWSRRPASRCLTSCPPPTGEAALHAPSACHRRPLAGEHA